MLAPEPPPTAPAPPIAAPVVAPEASADSRWGMMLGVLGALLLLAFVLRKKGKK